MVGCQEVWYVESLSDKVSGRRRRQFVICCSREKKKKSERDSEKEEAHWSADGSSETKWMTEELNTSVQVNKNERTWWWCGSIGRESGWPQSHKMRSGAEKRNPAGGRQCYQVVGERIERSSNQWISKWIVRWEMKLSKLCCLTTERILGAFCLNPSGTGFGECRVYALERPAWYWSSSRLLS